MGNGHGHHGDPSRKSSTHGHHSEGFVFGDNSGRSGREMSPFDHVAGPVDVTRPSDEVRQPRHRGHRPRSTTESGPRRHVTIDVADKDSYNLERQMSTGARPSTSVDGAPKKMPTIIKYGGQGREVYVCGSFNNWQKMKMSRSQKDFVAMVNLGEGDHEYKFIVDGQWTVDPSTAIVEKTDGVKNNQIHVQKEDFDAYDALDMDSAAVAKSQMTQKARATGANGPPIQTCFGQEAPVYVGDPTSHVTSRHQSQGPPILPPHLLQVILNKDTPMSCEPTLLPEPNHVMLNHLYALSIKDGVMVLSTTQRFKKKYVTTLLYKPMGIRVPEEK